MKTLKLSLAAIALSVGIAGAFAENLQHKAVNTSTDNLVWYQTISDSNPAPNTNSTQYASAQAAEDALGCFSGSKYCAAQFNTTTQQPTGEVLRKP